MLVNNLHKCTHCPVYKMLEVELISSPSQINHLNKEKNLRVDISIKFSHCNLGSEGKENVNRICENGIQD